MPEQSETRDALVAGAGIVGICTALALQERGFSVRLIDREGPAESTSYGNAGVISPWSCVPQAMPGLWKRVPKWLFDPEGPLSVRLSYLPRLTPWLIEFLKAGSMTRLPVIADAMMALNRPNLDLYRQLLSGTGEDDLVRDCHYLHVSRKPDGVDPESLAWRVRRERGVPMQSLSGDELREIEPELSSEVRSGMMIRSQGRTVNPGRLGKVLAARAAASGVAIERAEIQRIVPIDGGGYTLQTNHGDFAAGTVILTAGVWSERLLRPLGVRVRLEAERGYHMIFKDPGIVLNNAIHDVDNTFVASSMEMGIRSAGTAEFAGIDSAPDYRRSSVFVRHTQSLLPGIRVGETEPWMGRRPSTPDSLPYIGEVPGFPRLFCGFGHAHLGLTGAPMTGRLIAMMAVDERPNIDMAPYRLDRFD